LCLIVLPLPPGKNPFAAKINKNNNNLRKRAMFIKGNINPKAMRCLKNLL
jgi:hypothetical protein